MSELAFYRAQSVVTAPGPLEDLPGDPRALGLLVRGLLIHREGTAPFGYELPAERRAEAETRYAADILAVVRGRNPAPLTVPRAPDERFVGTCRDFAVLLCAFLRHTGTPARVRCGYATYIEAGFHTDHWVTEYWRDGWRLVDAEMLAREMIEAFALPFDPMDVPREEFLVGGSAWRACREGRADPATFGVRSVGLTGWELVRGSVVSDLAALNKVEMLPWDSWGTAEEDDPDLDLLDRAAALGEAGGPFAALHLLYLDSPGLRVPAEVLSHTTDGERLVTLRG
ncbi:transglutaminase domain-containing protein [Longispora sp. K20-0274]|uniref:transglutaminase domain-containing protein n=1 Tax=Longispora sp. K20-0274 TaxID=3088255 RepID=UPI00399A26DA